MSAGTAAASAARDGEDGSHLGVAINHPVSMRLCWSPLEAMRRRRESSGVAADVAAAAAPRLAVATAPRSRRSVDPTGARTPCPLTEYDWRRIAAFVAGPRARLRALAGACKRASLAVRGAAAPWAAAISRLGVRGAEDPRRVCLDSLAYSSPAAAGRFLNARHGGAAPRGNRTSRRLPRPAVKV